MKLDLKGLTCEKRNGVIRYRVRSENDANKKRMIPREVTPEHPDFMEYYRAYRAGLEFRATPAKPPVVRQSLRWLTEEYLNYLEGLTKSDQASPYTLKQRRSQLRRMCDHPHESGRPYGDFPMVAPKAAFTRLKNAMADRPGEANNTLKAIRAMYVYAIDQEWVEHDPTEKIKRFAPSKGGGARPWTPDDLRKYRQKHPPGTQAHLYLTLLMFTGARIGDACWLGPKQIIKFNGRTWLKWQPTKKGSAEVMLPLMKPLQRAISETKLTGTDTFMVTAHGAAFRSPEGLRNRMQKWCAQAGIKDRSSHGIRKSLGNLLADYGLTPYAIMSVLAHTEAKTTEIYTRDVKRRKLAEEAMDAIQGVDW